MAEKEGAKADKSDEGREDDTGACVMTEVQWPMLKNYGDTCFAAFAVWLLMWCQAQVSKRQGRWSGAMAEVAKVAQGQGAGGRTWRKLSAPVANRGGGDPVDLLRPWLSEGGARTQLGIDISGGKNLQASTNQLRFTQRSKHEIRPNTTLPQRLV